MNPGERSSRVQTDLERVRLVSALLGHARWKPGSEASRRKSLRRASMWTIGGDPVIRHSIARPAHWPPPTERPSDWPCPRDIRKRKLCPRCSMRTGTQAREGIRQTARSPIRAHTPGQSQLATDSSEPLAAPATTQVLQDHRLHGQPRPGGAHISGHQQFRDRSAPRSSPTRAQPCPRRTAAFGALPLANLYKAKKLESAMKVRDQDRLLWAAAQTRSRRVCR